MLRDTLKPPATPPSAHRDVPKEPKHGDDHGLGGQPAGSRAVCLKPACAHLPRNCEALTWHRCKITRKGCRGFILLPGCSLSLFNPDKRSACHPCPTEGDTEVPLQLFKSALPCPPPQLRDAAPILTKKADDSSKKKKKENKKVTFRAASLSTRLLQQVQAGASPSPDAARSDFSSHERIAGSGPGLSLDTRCPLLRYILTLQKREPWIAAFGRGSDSATRAGLRETTWLCPRWGHEAGGALSHAAAAIGSQRTQPALSSRSEQTPNGQRPQVGGNWGGGFAQDRRSNSPAPPQLPAPPLPTPYLPPGTSPASPLPKLWGIHPHERGGHRAGDLCSCAVTEAPDTPCVTFSQATARTGSGRGQARVPRSLQGLTTLILLFKFSVFI